MGSLPELLLGLTEYFAVYNGERPHQALGNRTTDAMYRLGEGDDATTVNRFGAEHLGQRQTAAIEVGGAP